MPVSRRNGRFVAARAAKIDPVPRIAQATGCGSRLDMVHIAAAPVPATNRAAGDQCCWSSPGTGCR